MAALIFGVALALAGCHEAARPAQNPADAQERDDTPSCDWVERVARSNPGPEARTPTVRSRCVAASEESFGDAVALEVTPGTLVGSVGEIASSTRRWREVERVTSPDYGLVALEWPGNEAALVVLAPVGDAHCVRAVWGYSFGGLGVELSISDVARAAGDVVLVALEAAATHNDPSRSSLDPTQHRRVVLAVGESRAWVTADTERRGAFQRHRDRHWYFETPDQAHAEDPVLVAAGASGVKRWRFAAGAWEPLPTPSR